MAGEGRRLVLAILSIAVIVACVIVIARWAKRTGGPAYEYQVRTICQNCKQASVHKIKEAPEFPLTCPHCGQRACWEIYRCNACEKEFPVEPGKMVTRCPFCGDPNVGAAP